MLWFLIIAGIVIAILVWGANSEKVQPATQACVVICEPCAPPTPPKDDSSGGGVVFCLLMAFGAIAFVISLVVKVLKAIRHAVVDVAAPAIGDFISAALPIVGWSLLALVLAGLFARLAWLLNEIFKDIRREKQEALAAEQAHRAAALRKAHQSRRKPQ